MCLFLGLSSFTSSDKPQKSIKSGFYQISYTNSLKKGILLLEDKTFIYVDSEKSVEIKGTFIVVNEKLILKATEGKLPIQEIWKIDSENCIKTRKGLTFIRVCNC